MNEIESMLRSMGIEANYGIAGLVAIILNRLGDLLKRIEPFPNKYIPLAVVAAGSPLYAAFTGFTAPNLGMGFCVGILTVGGYELFTTPFRKPKPSDPANSIPPTDTPTPPTT